MALAGAVRPATRTPGCGVSADNRLRNVKWAPGEDGKAPTWERVIVAVLLDLRDELQALNQTLGCYRVGRMTDDVHRIERRIAKHLPLRAAKKKARRP